jgi:ribosomal-protein-alanine acetyltransferase
MMFGPARRDDLDALVSIERGSPRAWAAGAFEDELGRDPPTLFVLRASDRAVAFVVTRLHLPEMDIVNLAVEPDLRRRGLGRAALGALLEQSAALGVASVFLEVREGNTAARRLYENAGFGEFQRRPAFYLEPIEDAILMRLQMGHPRG